MGPELKAAIEAEDWDEVSRIRTKALVDSARANLDPIDRAMAHSLRLTPRQFADNRDKIEAVAARVFNEGFGG